MNKDQLPIILTETPFQEIEKEYRIGDVIFEKFSIKNILRYADNETVFISHHRKNTSFVETYLRKEIVDYSCST
jgi:hypothetical protein